MLVAAGVALAAPGAVPSLPDSAMADLEEAIRRVEELDGEFFSFNQEWEFLRLLSTCDAASRAVATPPRNAHA